MKEVQVSRRGDAIVLSPALERAGKPIGNLDLMIASHAVAEEATVVTNDVQHFASVHGLKVEEWK